MKKNKYVLALFVSVFALYACDSNYSKETENKYSDRPYYQELDEGEQEYFDQLDEEVKEGFEGYYGY